MMGSVQGDTEGDVVSYRQARYSDGPPGDFIIGKTLAGTTIRLTELQQQNHIILSASVGGGKASTMIIPNVLREQGYRSFFATNPKGDLFDLTSGAAARYHEIWHLYPDRPDLSHRYDPLAHIHSLEDAQTFAEAWISNTGRANQDPFWDREAEQFLTLLAMHVRESDPTAHFPQLLDLINKSYAELRTVLLNSASKTAQMLATRSFSTWDADSTIRTTVLGDMATRFNAFMTPRLHAITSANTIDFMAMVERPIGLYLTVAPSEVERLRPLTACFVSQMFRSWSRYAMQQPEHALPRMIMCYLDEFAQCGKVSGMSQYVTTMRSQKISLLIAMQNMHQLEEIYGDQQAKAIINSAKTHIVFSGVGREEEDYYSKRISSKSIFGANEQRPPSGMSVFDRARGLGRAEEKHEPITAEVLRALPRDEVVVIPERELAVRVRTTPFYLDRQLKLLSEITPVVIADVARPSSPVAAPHYTNSSAPASPQQAEDQSSQSDSISITRANHLDLTSFALGLYPLQRAYPHPALPEVRVAMEQARKQNLGGAVLIGPALVGKTRLAIEAMRAEAADTLIVTVNAPISAHDISVIEPLLRDRRVVLFLDDLPKLVPTFEASVRLISAFQVIQKSTKQCLVLATAPNSVAPEPWSEQFCPELGLTQIAIKPLPPELHLDYQNTVRKALARDQNITLDLGVFDGFPGTLMLLVDYEVSGYGRPDFPEAARAIVRAQALLADVHITPLTVERVRRVARQLYGLRDNEWDDALQFLQTHHWLNLQASTDKKSMIILPTSKQLLMRCRADVTVIVEGVPSNPFERLQTLLSESPVDSAALFQMSERVRDSGGAALAVRALEAALPHMKTRSLEWMRAQIALAASLRLRAQNDDHQRALGVLKTVLQTTREQESIEWALAHYQMGLIALRLPRQRAVAIDALTTSLQVLTPQRYPQEWAQIEQLIGQTLLMMGDETAIEQAIAAFTAALQVLTIERQPGKWASLQQALGDAYRQRSIGDVAQNQDAAIAAYQSCLLIYTKRDTPLRWAQIQNSLGVLFSDRLNDDHEENIHKAIVAFTGALEVYARQSDPKEWAIIQANLANAFIQLQRGNVGEYMEHVIQALEPALEVITWKTQPEDWVLANLNLGYAYLHRTAGVVTNNIETAIQIFQSILNVSTSAMIPYDWALTQLHLGRAYSRRRVGEREENYKIAREVYTNSLTIFTRDEYPDQWAKVQSYLDELFATQTTNEHRGDIEEAIKALKHVIDSTDPDRNPREWATAQKNLALAYLKRIHGSRSDNLELALAACEETLRVVKQQSASQDWALIQMTLGDIYAERIVGNVDENSERALNAYRSALTILSREQNALDWAALHNKLGSIYRNRTRGNRPENLEYAVQSYNAALRVYTRAEYPLEWANSSENLALVYEALANDAYDTSEHERRAVNCTQALRTEQQVLEYFIAENNEGRQTKARRILIRIAELRDAK